MTSRLDSALLGSCVFFWGFCFSSFSSCVYVYGILIFWNYHVSLETRSKHSAFVHYSIILAQWSLVGQGVNLKLPMMPFDDVTADFTI